jgi:hypothetical protein
MRAAAAAERMAKRIQTLAELGMTRAESALFTAIYYGYTVPPAELPQVAVMEDYWEDGSRVTEDECRAALTDCLARGWLQVIDAETLAGIVEELKQGRVLGPIYGLPCVGAVDFTHAGAKLSRKEDDAHQTGNQPPPYYEDTVYEKFSQFSRSERAALAAIEEVRRWDENVTTTGPSLTGPWRVQWWRRFAAGFQVDFEQKRQWQGRGGGSLGQTATCILAQANQIWAGCSMSSIATMSPSQNGYSFLPWRAERSIEHYLNCSPTSPTIASAGLGSRLARSSAASPWRPAFTMTG